MAIRVTVNEKGVVQQESGTTAAVDINVPLTLNSNAALTSTSITSFDSSSWSRYSSGTATNPTMMRLVGTHNLGSGNTGMFAIASAPVVGGASGVAKNVSGLYLAPTISNTTGTTGDIIYGIQGTCYRAAADDLGTNTFLIGMTMACGSFTGGAASYTTNFIHCIRSNLYFGVPTTVTSDVIGLRADVTVGSGQLNAAAMTAVDVRSGTWSNALTTVTTFYGLRLQTISGAGANITNRWGISQEDSAANNVYAGRSAMGQAAGTAATALVDVGASTTARSQLRLRSGTAPTSPNDGDIWFDGTNLKMQVSGVTKTFTLV